MKKTRIAELVVGFVMDGASKALSTVRSVVSHVATAAKYVATVGAAVQGGILFKAAQGTREGDQFSQSMSYLARVVGNVLAPYLRMVTTVIVRLADGFRALSPSTQRWIAMIGVGAVAIAGLIALAPVVTAAWAAVGAVIGTVWAGIGAVVTLAMSPVGLVIAAVVALAMAFATMFGGASDAGADASNSLQDSSKSWIEVALKHVRNFALAFASAFNGIMSGGANAFNWLMRQSAAVSDAIGLGMAVTYDALMGVIDPAEAARQQKIVADVLAKKRDMEQLLATGMRPGIKPGEKGYNPLRPIGPEKLTEIEIKDLKERLANLHKHLPTKVADVYRDMPPIQPIQIDPIQIDKGAVNGFFDNVDNGIKKVAKTANATIPKLFGALKGLFGALMDPADNKGFQVKMKVSLESGQGTYDRLLKAFAEGDQEDLQRQILDQNKAFNENLNKARGAIVGAVEQLGKDFGIIGP